MERPGGGVGMRGEWLQVGVPPFPCAVLQGPSGSCLGPSPLWPGGRKREGGRARSPTIVPHVATILAPPGLWI